jgi:hypothetical protein
MTCTLQLTEHLTVWELWYFKAVTSYRGKRFHVPTRLTTVTRQTCEYKVDLTRHLKFPLAKFGERSFPTLLQFLRLFNENKIWIYPFLHRCRPTCIKLENVTQTIISLCTVFSKSGFVNIQSLRQLLRKSEW